MNLINDVGRAYFADRLRGCVFKGPDGSTCILDDDPYFDGDVRVRKIKMSGMQATQSIEHIPKNFFTSLKFLKVPPLGYRTASRGRVLLYMSRNNTTYTRGISVPNNLTVEYSPHTEFLISMRKINHTKLMNDGFLASLVLNPEYLTLDEGIKQLNAGSILSFAINHEYAVAPEDDTTYTLLFNKKKVGTVTPEAEIRLLPEFSDLELEAL